MICFKQLEEKSLDRLLNTLIDGKDYSFVNFPFIFLVKPLTTLPRPASTYNKNDLIYELINGRDNKRNNR